MVFFLAVFGTVGFCVLNFPAFSRFQLGYPTKAMARPYFTKFSEGRGPMLSWMNFGFWVSQQNLNFMQRALCKTQPKHKYHIPFRKFVEDIIQDGLGVFDSQQQKDGISCGIIFLQMIERRIWHRIRFTQIQYWPNLIIISFFFFSITEYN